MKQKRTLAASFKHAFEGVFYSLKHNRNLRIHFAAGVLVLVLSIILNVSFFEKLALFLTILIVVSAEMINSAIEEIVNLVTREHRAEAKIAKDVAAGMVLVTATGSVIIGLLIFTPYLLKLFR